MPELLAGCRVDRVDMVERRRQEHHAVDDDRCGFHRFQHRGLEHKLGRELANVGRGNLRAGVIACVRVIAVRMDPVFRIARGVLQHHVGNRRQIARHRLGARRRCTGLLRADIGDAQCERDCGDGDRDSVVH